MTSAFTVICIVPDWSLIPKNPNGWLASQLVLVEYYMRHNMVQKVDTSGLRTEFEDMIGEHLPRLQIKVSGVHMTDPHLSTNARGVLHCPCLLVRKIRSMSSSYLCDRKFPFGSHSTCLCSGRYFLLHTTLRPKYLSLVYQIEKLNGFCWRFHSCMPFGLSSRSPLIQSIYQGVELSFRSRRSLDSL